MYNRDFGGIRSDGQLDEMRESMRRDYVSPPSQPVSECLTSPAPLFNLNLDFLKKLEVDDLIIIAIGVLLLLDSDCSTDMILLLIAAVLFF